ncbi:UPF0061 protein FMP40 [Meyerozyma sp. JA9]|nr:UPF0061 protein FMP40 [Meyerozyma sp. JA9]
MHSLRRRMSIVRLSEVPKSSSFTKLIKPDARIETPDVALENKDNIIHRPRILQFGGFSWSLPEERKETRLLTWSPRAIEDLGLDPKDPESSEFQDIVSGELYLKDKEFLHKGYPFPYSQAYAGWQFGQFAGQLGDGRVHNLFEIKKPKGDGENRDVYEIQLKGSGMTPYSRFADGKAVLRSSIREYIISEHLHAIGIPTTRALSLTYLPQTLAQRHRVEKCAIVSRFAESWIRLGTFDLYRWRGDRGGIRDLSDYVINELFTVNGNKFHNLEKTLKNGPDFFSQTSQSLGNLTDYDKMYLETVVRNASTSGKWQVYGFLNGVLNTDNTSILGLSMDFGPFSIMDRYNPDYTPNSEDHDERYSYKHTPTAIWWNLTRLGENLAELIGAGEQLINDSHFKNEGIKPEWEDPIIKRATKLIEVAADIYQYAHTVSYVNGFYNRLGLNSELVNIVEPEEQRQQLIVPMLDMLKELGCDFNRFFVILQESGVTTKEPKQVAEFLLPYCNYNDGKYSKEEVTKMISDWVHTYQKEIEKSEKIQPGHYEAKVKSYNPVFLPRNWILDQVIEKTEESEGKDLSYLMKLQKMSLNPYDESKWGDELKEVEKTWKVQDHGDEYAMLQCSCSS